jgi:heme-degrading monooxygenase HmoA
MERFSNSASIDLPARISAARLIDCPESILHTVGMILEVATLDIKPGRETEFESAFGRASEIIARMKGYHGHELQRCVENPGRYILFVRWATIEDHTIGFRQSGEYQQWRSLLHHFYDPFPKVEHYTSVSASTP